MGLAVARGRLALATRHAITLFAKAPLLAPDLLPKERGRYDSLFLPRATYHTGDVNVHDVAFADDGLWFVNSTFSCLSALSKDFSFVPRWQPPFISEIVPEDRCNLNGLAVTDGKPKYVTALGASDVVGGWRENKASGGIVIDVASGRDRSSHRQCCRHVRIHFGLYRDLRCSVFARRSTREYFEYRGRGHSSGIYGP